jgi:serine protease Do
VPLPRRVVRHHHLPASSGVLVVEVVEKGPAARASVASGDLVVSFNGEPIERTDDLHRVLTGDRAGTVAELGVLRGVDFLALRVTPEPA